MRDGQPRLKFVSLAPSASLDCRGLLHEANARGHERHAVGGRRGETAHARESERPAAARSLAPLARARDAVLFLELHPAGMNGWGDPVKAIGTLREEQAVITTFDGRAVTQVEPSANFQVVARWR